MINSAFEFRISNFKLIIFSKLEPRWRQKKRKQRKGILFTLFLIDKPSFLFDELFVFILQPVFYFTKLF